VSFIDDHNKFVWIYLLRYKSQVFEKFNEFQQLVERRFNRKIVAIQTDWGGEYEKLNYFFRKVGISHLVSCPHAHQQNGAAEHKHRHIVEVGLSLLAHSSIPLKYWDEAFLAATYLINRTPAKSLQFSSPHEVLFQEKPEYSMLRVFGCACWPNLRPYNTHKLVFRSKRCVFLGYNNMHKGFKCLDISTSHIYISRDVIFDEQIFPFAELHANAGARLRSDIELLPSNLYDSSLPFGSTTISSTDVINSTSNPPDNSHPNLEANAQEEPILHAAPRGRPALIARLIHQRLQLRDRHLTAVRVAHHPWVLLPSHQAPRTRQRRVRARSMCGLPTRRPHATPTRARAWPTNRLPPLYLPQLLYLIHRQDLVCREDHLWSCLRYFS
jgi:histone deacetylase 1/2